MKTSNNLTKILFIAIGMILSLVVLEASLQTAAAIRSVGKNNRNIESIRNGGTFRILCLGESTTDGQYPWQLEEILNAKNTGVKFQVIDKGRGGSNTDLILAQLNAYLDEYKPDLVVAMMGINDSREDLSIYEYANGPWYTELRTYKLIKILKYHIRDRISAIKNNWAVPADNIFTKYIGKFIRAGCLNTPANINSNSALLKNEHEYLEKETAFRNLKKYKEAESMLVKAIELSPNDDWLYSEMGDIYREQNRFNEAEEIYRKALTLNPGSAKAYTGIGHIYLYIKRDYSKAEIMLLKAIKIDPKYSWACQELGTLYTNTKRYKESEAVLRKAIELNPKDESSYVNLGNNYISQKQYSEAQSVLLAALKINPLNDFAYYTLGNIYMNHKKYAEAESMYRKTLDINPQNDWAYFGLGALYAEQKKYKLSETMYRTAVKLNPNNDSAYQGLGELYTLQKNYKEGLEMYLKSLDINPNNDWAYALMAENYSGQGLFSDAKKNYLKAVEINPQNDWAINNLEKLLVSMKASNQYAETTISSLMRRRNNGEGNIINLNIKYAVKNGNKYFTCRTRYNYNKLRNILHKNNIKLLCVQYPTLELQPLKDLLESTDDVVFADNEKVFKDAVSREGYDAYFLDHLADTFGHCTYKGNRLLADNIADVIISKYFSK